MTKFTERLWSDLVREQGPVLAEAVRPGPGWARILRRPHVLAGSSLGLAGAGAALAVVLGAVGTPPAYAITRQGDGSVLVTVNRLASLPQANAKLTAMGIHEQVTIYMASGPANVSGPVACTPGPGASLSGPPLEVLVGKDGTEVIGPGQSAGNTGEGTFHLARCTVAPNPGTGPGTGSTGNTGAG
ncbi:MAG TPA: hypothetical protein VKU88_02355 [Acidimicrobiales bacterium]|nr:hypothetical protein [Acidimicrobiales bacterium]